MRRVIVFIMFLSFVLFYLAPNHVDKTYCWICLTLFLIEVFIILRIDIKSKLYLSFNTLFFLSFFLTSFAYALFVHDTPADLLGSIERNINFNYLTKGSALCLVASSVYSFGYIRALNIKKCKRYVNQFVTTNIPIGSLHFLKTIYIGVFLLLFILATLFLSRGGSVNLEGGDLLSSIFESLFPVVLLLNTLKEKPQSLIDFFKKNILILSLCGLMMLTFIRIGDRGLVLTCGVQIVAIYTLCVKRMKFVSIGLLMLIGLIMMFVIRQTRIGADYSSTTSSVSSFASTATSTMSESGAAYGAWYYLSDLTNISHELCLGYEYSQTHGLFYPIEEIVLNIVSPIPLLPTLISNYVFGKPTSEFNTGVALNKYMAGFGEAHFGNHCVIDIYMSWGMLGVIIIFWGFGYIMAKCYNKVFENMLLCALYVLLISNAIYVPRNMVLSLIRPAVYVWFFVWIVFSQQKKHQYSLKTEKNTI